MRFVPCLLSTFLVVLSSTSTAAPFKPLMAEKKNYNSSVELGFILASGNTEATAFMGKVNHWTDLLNWRTNIKLDAFYQEKEREDSEGNSYTERSAEKYFASAQGNYKLEDDKEFVYFYGSHSKNSFGGVKKNSLVSVGYGARWLKRTDMVLDATIGPGYSEGERKDGSEIGGVLARLAANYQWTINKNMNFNQELSVEAAKDNTRTKSSSSVALKVNGDMQLKVGINITNDTKVPDTAKNTDTETRLTLVYNF